MSGEGKKKKKEKLAIFVDFERYSNSFQRVRMQEVAIKEEILK
jgi:hypothetical protein